MRQTFYSTYGGDLAGYPACNCTCMHGFGFVFLVFWQMHITVLLVSSGVRHWKEGCLDLSCISVVVHISSLGCQLHAPKKHSELGSFPFKRGLRQEKMSSAEFD